METQRVLKPLFYLYGAVTVGLPPAWVDVSEEIAVNVQRVRTKMADERETHLQFSISGKPEGLSTSEVRDKLEHAITHAENTKKKAFEKSVSRWKAKEDAMEALCKNQSSAESFPSLHQVFW
ncbi:hypothetical protein Vadar_013548 [Vaccinium darrowii]|uniref:Uncharacterized protein n=1 Tax=Vaccinium darrowii TaxID=229202 RepID=A0ACB7ZCD0_9ERIC|nr:hypothetical protein Vadar_013548 [Vaccinium darrowii]